MEKWPNLFIVGAPKAGTTSLYEYLKNIPEIYMSPIKEPHYFSSQLSSKNLPFANPIRDKKKYLNLFKKAKNEKFLAESSPSYLLSPESPALIHQVSPNARIIISLRNPVERIFSQYMMLFGNGRLKLSFNEQLHLELEKKLDEDQLQLGLHKLYSVSVKRYFDIFGSKQVKVIIFEEFVQNPKETVEEILKFLDLSQNLDDFKIEARNPFSVARGPVAKHVVSSKTTRKLAKTILSTSTIDVLKHKFLFKRGSKPKMKKVDLELLVNFYHDEVKKLENILGRKLPWPNF